MLEDKHSITAVFLAHRKEVKIGYGQFRRYVNEFIRRKPEEKKVVEQGIKKESVAERIRKDPNYVSETLKLNPDRPKEDLT